MSQPSLTIKAFLQQAEDGLALLRTKATPRKKAMAEGSASVQVSRLLRESGQEDAKDQLELQARTMLALDRRLRGFDARFKALEKAIASAAELAAESSRCGRDGMEAATAAAAAVRVEAEAKCRDLSKRIDGLSAPSREDAERVQQWLGEDVESIEKRLRSQLEQRAEEVLQASQCIAAELKAEVQMELASFREDLSFRSRPPGAVGAVGAESAWERLLLSTKEDLRRAVHGVADLESRVQGEERVYWSVVQSLEQRVGSLEASSNQMLDDRMGKLEAQIARLDRTPGARPQPSAGSAGSVVQDPAVKRPRGMLASMALAEMPQVELTQMTPRIQEPERLRVEGKIEAAEVVSPPLPASPASSSAPSPHLRGVPLQPPGRPSRLMRGSLRPSSEPEDAGKFGRTARPDTEPMRPSAQTSHEASQAAPSLVAEAQTMSVPIEQGGRADSSGSSSPTFSDSANLSQLLRSTSAMERSEGPSSGSRSPMITVTQPQAARDSSGRGAQEADAENEPVCAFSTNVSDEGFRSGDDLMLR